MKNQTAVESKKKYYHLLKRRKERRKEQEKEEKSLKSRRLTFARVMSEECRLGFLQRCQWLTTIDDLEEVEEEEEEVGFNRIRQVKWLQSTLSPSFPS